MTPQEQLKQMSDQLQRSVEARARKRQEEDRNAVFSQLGKYLSAALKPMLNAVEEMKRIGTNLGILSSRLNNLEIPRPEVRVDMSSLKIPTPNITVKPIVDLPKMPSEMDVKGWIGLMGYDRGFLTNPLPVQLRDASGNPIKLFENLTQVVGGGGWSGGGNHVIVDNLGDISITSSGSSSVSLVNADGDYYNSDNPLPVSFAASGTSEVRQVSGAVDSVNILQVGGNPVQVGSGEGANALRVYMATDAIASVNIVSGSSSGTEYPNGSTANPPTGTVAMGNTGEESGNLWAMALGGGVTGSTVLRVVHVTDAAMSTNIINSDLDIRDLANATDSVSVYQVSGANWSTNVTNTITVTGSLTSSVTVGPTVADAVDDGNAPVQMGGIARTANPTAVSGGDVVKASMDDVGRQLTRPIQVRDLIATAYASITSGTETTLATAAAGTYLDLIYVMGTNNSDAAVTVDIRAVSGGNIQTSIRIPANGTSGVALPVPIPQDATGNAWTADLPDITGTTVTISALFSKEV